MMRTPLMRLRALVEISQGVLDHMETLHPDECDEDVMVELKEEIGSAKVALGRNEPRLVR